MIFYSRVLVCCGGWNSDGEAFQRRILPYVSPFETAVFSSVVTQEQHDFADLMYSWNTVYIVVFVNIILQKF